MLHRNPHNPSLLTPLQRAGPLAGRRPQPHPQCLCSLSCFRIMPGDGSDSDAARLVCPLCVRAEQPPRSRTLKDCEACFLRSSGRLSCHRGSDPSDRSPRLAPASIRNFPTHQRSIRRLQPSQELRRRAISRQQRPRAVSDDVC